MSGFVSLNSGKKAPTTDKGILLGPLSILARQRKTWSPALLAGVLWRVATNAGRHRQIRKILELPEYGDLAGGDARFAFKYLTHGYLARRLTVGERATCFAHHYLRLRELLPGAFLQRMLRRDVPLFAAAADGSQLAITLGLPRDHDKEGELAVNLTVDGKVVFLISFTIVPGTVVAANCDEVLLIGRIQGMKGYYQDVRRATKALHDVAPTALLVAALRGLGAAFGIRTLACVSAVDQNSYDPEADHAFRAAYDHFFEELGIQRNGAGFYVTAMPLPEKPLLLVKQGHKLRTRKKREFKRELAGRVEGRLTEICLARSRQAAEVRPATLAEPVWS